MRRTQQLGTNRGVPRIWIEGQALSSSDWKKGDRFDVVYRDGRITYVKSHNGKRTVAGDDKRPVIDTENKKIIESLGDVGYVKIHVTPVAITIVRGKAPKVSPLTKVATLLTFALGSMRVLVACEESATVRDQFAALGHDAVSCDQLDTRNPHGWHIQGDVTRYLRYDWDMVLGFPPCTYLTISAAWAFKDPDYERYPGVGYHQRVKPGTLTGEARRKARDEAVAFVWEIWKSADKVCIENPRGSLSTRWIKPHQVIQPHQFGHAHSKATCLWLKGLEPLEPSNILDITKHGWQTEDGTWRWLNQTASGQNNLPPSKDRDKIRSTTYHGVAVAMAQQWGRVALPVRRALTA